MLAEGHNLVLICRFRSRRLEFLGLRKFIRLNLCFPNEFQIVVDRVVIIQAQVLRVGAHESFIEDATRKLLEVLLLDRLQHARADLDDAGDVIERELLLFARFAKLVSELAHTRQFAD